MHRLFAISNMQQSNKYHVEAVNEIIKIYN